MEGLFPYQTEGVLWLSTKKFGLLADEMGLGKSAQAIGACDRATKLPVLILCPAVARLNWTREWQNFSSRKLRLCVLLTTKDVKNVPSADVTICSYDLAASKKITQVLSATSFKICVLDESHYLKSRKAKRTRAVLEHIAANADHVWALSGTPAPNHPAELWPLLRFGGVYPKDYWSFVNRYCSSYETPYGTVITGGKRIPELRELMKPHLLRRKKEDVMKQLPAIHFQDVVVEPTPVSKELREIYFDGYILQPQALDRDIEKERKVAETLIGDIGMGADGVRILESLDTRLKNLRKYVGLQKVPKLIEMVKEELDNEAYGKIVIFGVHRCVVEEMRNGLREYGAVLIYGGTPPDKRDRFVKKFQEDPRCRVFVGNVLAAGTAITLTAAHQVLFAEADWVPANNQQAAMRCHRIGQTKPVTVRFAGLADSVDERIQAALKRKTRTLLELFDAPATPDFSL